ncbi:uncharacterized protein LOC119577652 [Penaeus monodon]|uniref:uncharacterized protein LOC119577652 n=1 Tax=Penaeus monodon TaxID=6687 RepID=UPI0018A78C48|nr:uncharacterized protein LOC119577652 [Penaeus monodon]
MPPPSGPSWTLQLLSCFLLAASASTFNIQADSAVVIKGEAGSKFGFDVALWTQQKGNKLVIGAPDDLADEGQRKGHVRSGRVFIFQQEESSVKTLKNITLFQMCAPRASFLYKRGTAESRVPLGKCLLIRDIDSKGEHIRPKSAFQETSDAIQYCGFSAVFGKNDSAVFLGCPSIMKENQS